MFYGRRLVKRMEAAYISFSSKDERLILILEFLITINSIVISKFSSLLNHNSAFYNVTIYI